MLAGPFTPSLVESIVRLGTWMPFVPVTEGIAYFCRVDLAEATARRKTEAAGHAYVEVQTAQVAALEHDEGAKVPVGPPVQLLSADGAMVPLLHQQWGEVKTVALGVVGAPTLNRRTGEWEVHTSELSYFSRMADHETFSRLATVETQRRGTATAGTVCAVNDGADWEQQFVDDHRPDAVRILDWGHGAEHVGKVASAVFGAATPAAETWRTAQVKELKQGDPDRVLRDLRQLRAELAGGTLDAEEAEAHAVGPVDQEEDASAPPVAATPRPLPAEALKVVTANLEYFEKRRDHIRYAAFAEAGYPIGSGAVESGNKLVVEARLKGAGMHWAPEHVNPMVALRTVAGSDRWEEAWPQITARLRAQTRERAARQRTRRREAARVADAPPPIAPFSLAGADASSPPTAPNARATPADPARIPPAMPSRPAPTPRRPAADHPWRRPLLHRQRQKAS